MRDAISIRAARIEDAPAIIAFQRAMAWETERLALDPATLTAGVEAVFNQPLRGQYWIAEEATSGEIAAALLTTFEWSDWRNGEIVWLQSVYVRPASRRRGIFRRMYEHVKQDAIASGRRGIRLYVDRTNEAAKATYRNLGMREDHYELFEWLPGGSIEK